VQISLAAGWL
jgi:polyphosphate kinase 2 (PPK2 family)